MVLMVVSVGIFISCMDGSMVNIATPSIAVTMGILPQTAQWVVTAYLLCITATLLLFGRIGDLIGGKPVYSTGFLIFAIGSGLCSQAGNVWLLALCRAFQAIGASMLMSTGMGIVTASFPPSQRGQALGTTGTVVGLRHPYRADPRRLYCRNVGLVKNFLPQRFFGGHWLLLSLPLPAESFTWSN